MRSSSERCRVFTTRWFAKAAARAGISEAALCKASRELSLGQGDNLGGGVWKKRAEKNLYREIVLAKAGYWWIFVYLFQKRDRANISRDELLAFREMAALYSKDADIAGKNSLCVLNEICQHESKTSARIQVTCL